jgi:hypothetical protein
MALARDIFCAPARTVPQSSRLQEQLAALLPRELLFNKVPPLLKYGDIPADNKIRQIGMAFLGYTSMTLEHGVGGLGCDRLRPCEVVDASVWVEGLEPVHRDRPRVNC